MVNNVQRKKVRRSPTNRGCHSNHIKFHKVDSNLWFESYTFGVLRKQSVPILLPCQLCRLYAFLCESVLVSPECRLYSGDHLNKERPMVTSTCHMIFNNWPNFRFSLSVCVTILSILFGCHLNVFQNLTNFQRCNGN